MPTLLPHRTPRSLHEPGKALWTELTHIHDYSGTHLRLLFVLCQAVDQQTDLREVIDREGPTYIAPSGIVKVRPEISLEQATVRTIAKLSRQLEIPA
jgi:hypothetical protein